MMYEQTDNIATIIREHLVGSFVNDDSIDDEVLDKLDDIAETLIDEMLGLIDKVADDEPSYHMSDYLHKLAKGV
jgi:hypothetical protein